LILKKIKHSKALLLKIFILQQKNKLRFDVRLKQLDLVFLSFLWENGFILGFCFKKLNVYTIFFKKQFKQFSIQFFEEKLKSKYFKIYNQASITSTPVVFSNNAFNQKNLLNKNVGGFLLCDIF